MRTKNSRHWTKTELNTYLYVLADPQNCFAATPDKLALKKLSNNEVFKNIQKQLVLEMETGKPSNEKDIFDILIDKL